MRGFALLCFRVLTFANIKKGDRNTCSISTDKNKVIGLSLSSDKHELYSKQCNRTEAVRANYSAKTNKILQLNVRSIPTLKRSVGQSYESALYKKQWQDGDFVRLEEFGELKRTMRGRLLLLMIFQMLFNNILVLFISVVNKKNCTFMFNA